MIHKNIDHQQKYNFFDLIIISIYGIYINIIVCSLAPSSPPVNITISVINATAFNSTWRIPDEDEHNGILVSVYILLVGVDIDTSITITVPITANDITLQTTILSPLQEYVNYSVEFVVRNGVGLSPYSNPIYLRTDPAGKYMKHHIVIYSSLQSIAPNDTPQNVATVPLSPTSIRITFAPPPEIDQNGPITSYNISYTGEIFDTVTQFVTVPISNPIYPTVVQVSFDLAGLQEYNNYTISVRAINGEGSSEFTAGVIQITDEAGKI